MPLNGTECPINKINKLKYIACAYHLIYLTCVHVRRVGTCIDKYNINSPFSVKKGAYVDD